MNYWYIVWLLIGFLIGSFLQRKYDLIKWNQVVDKIKEQMAKPKSNEGLRLIELQEKDIPKPINFDKELKGTGLLINDSPYIKELEKLGGDGGNKKGVNGKT